MKVLMVNYGRTMQPLPALKELRTARSLSQRALAKKSGVAHDTIGQIERGERLARTSTIRKLATALNVNPSVLSSSPDKFRSKQMILRDYKYLDVNKVESYLSSLPEGVTEGLKETLRDLSGKVERV